ncbi:phage tail domain-containing protein [Streptococcus porci]|uniref:phage tail domain-containing protein n=1 Tax=Streptococcus porci TaxID=502567 RepID=UPI0004229EB1|nr:phage tail domain-containing protein [Streptococcus porci]
MLKTFLDGKFPDDLPFCLAERPAIPTAEMAYEDIEIPGRDGNLTVENGYKDIVISCEYNLLEAYNIKGLLRRIKAFFIGKKELRFDDDVVFYKIKKVAISEIDNSEAGYGSFTVSFTCDPFQYEVSDTISMSTQGTLKNPGGYFSRPYLKVFGSGTLSINGMSVVLKDVSDYIEIDCEAMNAYKGTVDMNSHMTGEFPTLKVGDNKISWSGNISRIEGKGRWRYV